jgi:hypothetical protein
VITFSRALARQYRAVLRRALMADDPRGPWPMVRCRTDASGLTLESRQGGSAVRYHQEGTFADEALAFRGTLLAEIEGRTETPVTLEAVSPEKGRASWTDRGLPQVIDFEQQPDAVLPAFPELPPKLHRQPPELLQALAEASASAARESVRYAVSRIQLRGKSGEIVGTDGKQLLLQGGYRFPWADDLLVPALPVFAAPELPADQAIGLGRTDSTLALCVGWWTLVLALDTQGRFPKAETVIPRLAEAKSRLCIDAEDGKFLADALPKLPGDADDFSPVLVELANPPTVRSWSVEGGPLMEVILARSSAQGTPVQIRTDRQYLRRALRLGFTELHVTDAQKPVCCRDRSRCYVWVPLDPQNATLVPHTEVMRIRTTDTDAAPLPTTPGTEASPSPEIPIRSPEPMTVNSSTNGSHRDRTPTTEPPAPGGLADVIAETEALRDLLHDAFSRTSRLLAALKLQRRQSKAVAQAMASLKQLQLDR